MLSTLGKVTYTSNSLFFSSAFTNLKNTSRTLSSTNSSFFPNPKSISFSPSKGRLVYTSLSFPENNSFSFVYSNNLLSYTSSSNIGVTFTPACLFVKNFIFFTSYFVRPFLSYIF